MADDNARIGGAARQGSDAVPWTMVLAIVCGAMIATLWTLVALLLVGIVLSTSSVLPWLWFVPAVIVLVIVYAVLQFLPPSHRWLYPKPRR